MSVELKIKSKHLALEPKVIRHEELKLIERMKKTDSADKKNLISLELSHLVSHRRYLVRNEIRATELARAYISGKLYRSVEVKRVDEFVFVTQIVPRIISMVKKYTLQNPTEKTILDWAK